MTASDLLDAATLHNLVELDDGGYGLLAEMVDIFRDDTPHRIQDILAAAAAGDIEALSRAAHALKGGAGALGARALRFLAADLEALGLSAVPAAELPERLEACYRDSLAALEAYLAELKRG
ncbi:MAG: Hpt domain-containing protein [Holophagaceae bacterium]|nr:Hpt domain-containing protein [Acidobacteriota bacterium]